MNTTTIEPLTVMRNHIVDKIKNISKDINQISKEQWDWILDTTKDEGGLKTDFRHDLIRELGFDHILSYNNITNQPLFCIRKEFITGKNSPEKIKRGFKILSLYLKPIKLEQGVAIKCEPSDPYASIVFDVYDLKKENSPLLFVGEKNIKLDWLTEAKETIITEFTSFDTFIDWFFEQI
jgi:hypothetical protein